MSNRHLFFVRADSADGENLDLLVVATDKAQAQTYWAEHYDTSASAIQWVGAVPGVAPTGDDGPIDWEAVRMD